MKQPLILLITLLISLSAFAQELHFEGKTDFKIPIEKGEGFTSNDSLQGYDWSPDGTQVLIKAEREGAKELWIVSLIDGAIYQISPVADRDTIIMEKGVFLGSINWSKKNNMIVFAASSQIEKGIRCWIISPDSKEATKVSSDNLIHPSFPSWSPDGNFIVCEASSLAENGFNKDIYVLPIKGGKPKRLTSDAAKDRFPSWSPDGKIIAFLSDRGGKYEIWTVSSDGKNKPRQISSGLRPAGLLSWTPDSKNIIFARSDKGVWIIPTEGGEPRQILKGKDIISAIISPNGEEIMYTRKIKIRTKTLMRVHISPYSESKR